MNSQYATELLLLWASRAVRMARATATTTDDGTTQYCWEVLLGSAPTSRELDHALTALSVACRMSLREAQALQDKEIARVYLAMQGLA
jgi:hypothetical protein